MQQTLTCHHYYLHLTRIYATTQMKTITDDQLLLVSLPFTRQKCYLKLQSYNYCHEKCHLKLWQYTYFYQVLGVAIKCSRYTSQSTITSSNQQHQFIILPNDRQPTIDTSKLLAMQRQLQLYCTLSTQATLIIHNFCAIGLQTVTSSVFTRQGKN